MLIYKEIQIMHNKLCHISSFSLGTSSYLQKE